MLKIRKTVTKIAIMSNFRVKFTHYYSSKQKESFKNCLGLVNDHIWAIFYLQDLVTLLLYRSSRSKLIIRLLKPEESRPLLS